MSTSNNNDDTQNSRELPTPYGWLKEIDPATGVPFFVDTKANPPRSIWHHPFEDDQYLDEHPDMKEKYGGLPPYEASASKSDGTGLEVPQDERSSRRHSFEHAGTSRSGVPQPSSSSSAPRASSHPREKRSFLGKMKDGVIGTKEERAAARKREEELQQQRMKRLQELYSQQRQSGRGMYATPQGNPFVIQQQRYGGGLGGYNSYGGMGRYGGGYGGYGGGGLYGNSMYGNSMYGGRRRGMGGGMGMGMPLVGGLAGGMLLGSAMGGFDDCGGGGFDF